MPVAVYCALLFILSREQFVVARHRAGQCGVQISSEAKYLYILRNVQTDPGAHPLGTAGTFLGIKRLGREADESAPSVGIKNG